MPTTEQIASAEKLLGEPCLAEFSEDALKVRRNLLVVSLIVLIGRFYGIQVAPDSPIFGLHLLNISDEAIRLGLGISVAYLLFHFAWYAWDGFAEWRVRVTGTRQSLLTQGRWGSEIQDTSYEERGSTLYNWWKTWRISVFSVRDGMTKIEKSISGLQDAIPQMAASNIIQNSNIVNDNLKEIEKRVGELKNALEKNYAFAQSTRIEVSLGRFDAWFHFWIRSQNLRWLVIDVGAPLIIGSIAIALVVHPGPKTSAIRAQSPTQNSVRATSIRTPSSTPKESLTNNKNTRT